MKIPNPKKSETKANNHIVECPLCGRKFISLSEKDVERQYKGHYFFKHSQVEDEDDN